ncbi:MAG: T9SS type A sorting domain-containing protein [Sphingobacteriales bacterium]|nr:MAG: T9SS type A sorting domain-containing protein [Sphingobacteriales bacterium]
MLTANYMFNDPELVNGNAYYRLKMIDNEGKFKYSHVVLLSAEMAFEVKSVLNPFSTSISSEMIIPHDGIATINLFNEKGQLIKTYKNPVNKGINQVTVPAPANLATGIYFLSVEFNNESYKRKLFKQ